MSRPINRLVLAVRTSFLAPWLQQTATAWRWWIAEFSAMLPDNLKQIIESNNQRLIITADDDEFIVQYGVTGKLQDIGRITRATDKTTTLPLPAGIRQSVLLLAHNQVLRSEMTLPMAAEENLREVLSFEMDRQTPFRAEDVYYDYAITQRTPIEKTLTLQLFIVPRRVIDESLATLAINGIHPGIIAAHPLDNPDGLSINLTPEDKTRKQDDTTDRMNLSLAATILLLLATAILLPLRQKDQIIHSLQETVRSAIEDAAAGNQLRREVEELVDGSNYLLQKKQDRLTIMQLLDEITRVVPDDTWMNRIDMTGSEIQLQGQSAAAAELIALIEASPMFHNVRFRSPVTQVARTEQERFHLSAEVLSVQIE